MRSTRNTTLVLLSLVALAACGDETKGPVADTSASAEVAGNPVLGGRLGDAVKAVPNSSSKPLSKADASQPPPGGVFPAGLADQVMPANSAPKIEVLDDGSEPRLQLQAAVPVGKERVTLLAQVTLQGKSLLPPLVFELDLAPPALEGEAAPAGAAPVPAASASPLAPLPGADHPLVATIAKVELPGVKDVPKQLSELTDGMKGATIAFTMTPTGPKGFERAYSKQTDPKLVQALDLELSAIEDALSGLYTAAPSKPVGEGAYWMVTDRRSTLGTDIVRYRVFKIVKIDGDQAVLDVQVRQYAAGDKSALLDSTGMENPVIAEYQAAGEGKVQVGPGSRFPHSGQMVTQVTAQITPEAARQNPQGPRGELSFQIIAQIGTLPPEMRGAAANPKGPKKKPGPPGSPGPR